MRWPLLAAAVLAIASFQVGAMTVWVSVLSVALKAVLLCVAIATLVVGLAFLWQRFKDTDRA